MKSQHLPSIEEVKGSDKDPQMSELVQSNSYLDRRFNKNAKPTLVIGKVKLVSESNKPQS